MVVHASEKIPEQPRFAFAAGLLVIVLLVGVLVGSLR
jgi:hypothetical protein